MAFCLIKDHVNKFITGLKSGEIDPAKLGEMTSAERHDFLGKFVGEENAKQVNALFESKLLLKNKQAGMITWAKSVAGLKPEVRRDILSRIEKMDKILSPEEDNAFLGDLASSRLGVDVTEGEAKQIFDLTKDMQGKRAAITEDLPIGDIKRLDYGLSLVNLEKYVNDLKLQANQISFKEQPKKYAVNLVKQTPGVLKSIVASLDNSFFGRQGIKTLYTHPRVWTGNFLKSWGDIGKELKGTDAISVIKADIYSRPNALSGKYKAGGFGLDTLFEESFPSSLPEKIPLLGRLFKASESAYNGAAIRMRADLADILIKKAEEHGLNMLNPEDAKGVGSLVSSMTGRGNLGVFEPASGKLNLALFSVKFMKSNFDTLTMHLFDSKANSFVKKEAAMNMLKIVGTTAGILTIAKALNPESVDEDPRSSNFGKIKIFGQWTDITGGMGSMTTLATRMIPTYHNGKLSIWQKTSTGKYVDLVAGKYGQTNAWDLALDGLISNKLSPIAGIVRDWLKGETFQGEKFTFMNELQNVTIPLSLQQFNSFMNDPKSSFVLGSMILEGLGFSISNFTPKKKSDTNKTDLKGFWDTKTSKSSSVSKFWD